MTRRLSWVRDRYGIHTSGRWAIVERPDGYVLLRWYGATCTPVDRCTTLNRAKARADQLHSAERWGHRSVGLEVLSDPTLGDEPEAA